ncbi:putative O-acetylhomoserine (thiol)-lyase [Trichinella spiralis]|uniref:putative O-acetylhomoserine (thiol)-lyase n=1 Tax=Trichinella spiralis TaxID=6334 RepID=UPI0001EFD83F|nr:putative O-acetylhomoserine (thiol)-lyase [Trichinella spiralis]
MVQKKASILKTAYFSHSVLFIILGKDTIILRSAFSFKGWVLGYFIVVSGFIYIGRRSFWTKVCTTLPPWVESAHEGSFVRTKGWGTRYIVRTVVKELGEIIN